MIRFTASSVVQSALAMVTEGDDRGQVSVALAQSRQHGGWRHPAVRARSLEQTRNQNESATSRPIVPVKVRELHVRVDARAPNRAWRPLVFFWAIELACGG